MKATIFPIQVFQALERRENEKWHSSCPGGGVMESVNDRELRSLCKSVSEEQDPGRLNVLLDRLLQILEERQLLASLL